MINEAVILCGGFGTRLNHIIGDHIPKPMAPVNGRPFLSYLLAELEKAGVTHVVLATGYLHDVIKKYFSDSQGNISITYSHETEPLWTGGAVRQAAEYIRAEHFFVLNGDTLFQIDWRAFGAFHLKNNAPISIALRVVDDTARYGKVSLNGSVIEHFYEKERSVGGGLINGGIYVVKKSWLNAHTAAGKFSFEQDLLACHAGIFAGLVCNDYFIDIGVPEDYARAKKDFRNLFAQGKYLFLDRDGVLNRRVDGDYVRSWSQWEWLKGALEALRCLAKKFDRIIIVTNQQCIGKELVSQETIDTIHQKMREEVSLAGGRIDAVYVCGDLESTHSANRKPQIGMALQAQRDFPAIDFAQSVMVGDALSDMQFGWRCGMQCVYLLNNQAVQQDVFDYTDLVFRDLAEWEKTF